MSEGRASSFLFLEEPSLAVYVHNNYMCTGLAFHVNETNDGPWTNLPVEGGCVVIGTFHVQY
jgi:hypothetical protein